MLRLIVGVALLGYVTCYRMAPKDTMLDLPCEKCDITMVAPKTIRTLAPVCAACGDLYGPGFEHCCLCHEAFFDKCWNAAGRK